MTEKDMKEEKNQAPCGESPTGNSNVLHDSHVIQQSQQMSVKLDAARHEQQQDQHFNGNTMPKQSLLYRIKNRTMTARGWRALWFDVLQWFVSHPLTLTIALLYAVVYVSLCIAVYNPNIPLSTDSFVAVKFSQFSYLNWHTLFTTFVTLQRPLEFFVDWLLMIIIVSIAEIRLGAIRTTILAIVSGLCGIILGFPLCSLINTIDGRFSLIAVADATLNPLIMVVGAFMATSVRSPLLWRRRFLTIGYCSLLVFVLFRGIPSDYCMFMAAIVGQCLGYGIYGKPADNVSWKVAWNASSHEVRSLIAVISVVLSLGPIISIFTPSHLGSLTILGLLTGPGTVDWHHIDMCLSGAQHSGCIVAYNVLRLSFPGSLLLSLMPTLLQLVIAYGLYRGRRVALYCSALMNIGTIALAFIYYLVLPSFQVRNIPQEIVLLRYGAVLAFCTTALLPCFLLAILWGKRSAFAIRTRPHDVYRTIISIVIKFVVLSSVYIAYVMVDPASFKPFPTFIRVLLDVPERFLPIAFLNHSRPYLVPTTTPAMLFYQGVGIVFWVLLLIDVIRIMRPNEVIDEDSHYEAQTLFERGGESMSMMTTWTGNRYWFSATRRSAIAYQVFHNIALTTTGPFGDIREFDSDLDAFTTMCEEQSWTPVFYAVHAHQRNVLMRKGWKSIEVGAEMVVDPRSWQTKGRHWQDIRTSINKAKRTGMVDVVSTWEELPHNIKMQIIEISEEWMNLKSLPEMKYTLGGIDELKDPRVKLHYALDAEGVVQGVTSWMPTYYTKSDGAAIIDDTANVYVANHGDVSCPPITTLTMGMKSEILAQQILDGTIADTAAGKVDVSEELSCNAPMHSADNQSVSENPEIIGWTLDFMRHRLDSPNGVMEFLIARMAERLRDEGVAHFMSLSAAPLAGIDVSQMTVDDATSLPIQHVLEVVGDVIEPMYGFKSLFLFKKKFKPAEHSIYLCYPDSAMLVPISLAVLQAYLPGLTMGQAMEMLRSIAPKRHKRPRDVAKQSKESSMRSSQSANHGNAVLQSSSHGVQGEGSSQSSPKENSSN